MVYYGLNNIKLDFDALYKIVVLVSLTNLFTYLLTYLVATCLALALASKTTGLGLENAGLKPISAPHRRTVHTNYGSSYTPLCVFE